MGRTIIQPIGPLYGESVNGTVFGRPNGSIYVPPTNTIELELLDDYIRYYSNWSGLVICSSTGTVKYTTVKAESQDIASYMMILISDSNDFETVTFRTIPAGNFNWNGGVIGYTGVTITAGTTYYAKAVLYSSTGVAVATSEVYELTGWEE